MGLSLRKQRLRLTWVLAPLYLFLANPSPPLLVAGLVLCTPGLALRAFAAGTVHKDQSLAVSGPYAHVRHPLYLGSFLIGFGLVVAGGRWVFLPLFLGVFLWAYGRTVVEEERRLQLRFGEPYRRYQADVPAFLPRLRPYRLDVPDDAGRLQGASAPPGFRLWLYGRNKEWATAVGLVVGFGTLWLKVVLLG